MHIWYQWLESVKTSDINVYTNRQWHGPFALPTKTVLNVLLVAATKLDINLSHSWWSYNWKTKATTDDLHHHRSMQVKRDDHTLSSTTLWNQRYTPQIKNLGIISYTLTITTFKDEWTNNQGSMRNKLIRIKIRRVKTIWKLSLK